MSGRRSSMKRPRPISASIGYSIGAAIFALLFLGNQAAYGQRAGRSNIIENIVCGIAFAMYVANIPLIMKRIRWAQWYNYALLFMLNAFCIWIAIDNAITNKVLAGKLVIGILFLAPSFFISMTLIKLIFGKTVRDYFDKKHDEPSKSYGPFEIRPAKAQDIPMLKNLCFLEEDYHRHMYPDYFRESREVIVSRDLEKEIAETNCAYLVAIENEEAIGFVSAKKRVFSTEPQFKKIEYALIEDCAVRLEYRSKGVEKALLQAATDWAAQQGITRIQLQVWAKNGAAMQLYRGLGFQHLVVRMELITRIASA
jgi:GNAT superfamily N-acetyltransferase